jgi:hypothetical protein
MPLISLARNAIEAAPPIGYNGPVGRVVQNDLCPELIIELSF